jgi:hypothetical protein
VAGSKSIPSTSSISYYTATSFRYAYLTHKQGKEIEMLTDKIKTMEAVISNFSRRQRDPKGDNLESELHDSKLDINALKRLLRIFCAALLLHLNSFTM